jgi:hypothetical protein
MDPVISIVNLRKHSSFHTYYDKPAHDLFGSKQKKGWQTSLHFILLATQTPVLWRRVSRTFFVYFFSFHFSFHAKFHASSYRTLLNLRLYCLNSTEGVSEVCKSGNRQLDYFGVNGYFRYLDANYQNIAVYFFLLIFIFKMVVTSLSPPRCLICPVPKWRTSMKLVDPNKHSSPAVQKQQMPL